MPDLFSPLADFSIADVLAIARGSGQLKPLGSDGNGNHERLGRIEQSAQWVQATMQDVETAAQQGREATAYYAINTGFGDNAGRAAFKHVSEAEALSRKVLLSHTIGVGQHLPEDVVRAALLIRILSLSRGYSGIKSRSSTP